MSEVERIRRVYRAYDADAAAHWRWDPTRPGNVLNAVRRSEALVDLLRRNSLWPLGDKKVLEIGCGDGDILTLFRELGVCEENLHGIDLRPNALARALQRLPQAKLVEGNGCDLPYPGSSFDLVPLFTVFSSIFADEMMPAIARECERVLRPGGAVVWYEMRYPNPANREVHAVSRSEIRKYFRGLRPDLRPMTLVPHIARHLGSFTPVLFPLLYAIPALRSHWLGLLVKSA